MNETDQIRTLNTIVHHRLQVQSAIQRVTQTLERRALVHDESKFREDEFAGFSRINATAREHPYGSEEYRASLKAEKPTIQLHYSRNSHHPEHWQGPHDSPQGMGLFDLIEMTCDWWAAWKVYDGQREESKRSTWMENVAKQRDRFAQALSAEQWFVVGQVAALLEEPKP
jgi:hypothetical protein